MTLQRARQRAKDKDGRTRRERLRAVLLGNSGWVKVERLTPAARAVALDSGCAMGGRGGDLDGGDVG